MYICMTDEEGELHVKTDLNVLTYFQLFFVHIYILKATYSLLCI